LLALDRKVQAEILKAHVTSSLVELLGSPFKETAEAAKALCRSLCAKTEGEDGLLSCQADLATIKSFEEVGCDFEQLDCSDAGDLEVRLMASNTTFVK
jgi:hypothetical protein